jgi:hypothetical protein
MRTVSLRLEACGLELQLTARGYHRVLKLSSTIADLAGSETITQVRLAEALYDWLGHVKYLEITITTPVKLCPI